MQEESITNPIGVLYSTSQVANILGRHIRTVQRMIREGELVAIGNKRYLKIPAEELVRWRESELGKAREKAEARRRENET